MGHAILDLATADPCFNALLVLHEARDRQRVVLLEVDKQEITKT